MKLFWLGLVIFCVSCSYKKWEHKAEEGEQPKMTNYMRQVKHYQDSMSLSLITGANGVLPEQDLVHAKPMEFFPPDSNYRLRARFERILNGEVFEMPTSTDRLPLYKVFGILHFELSGQELQLSLYQNMEHPDYLFCPFKDQTNGRETYGAGRYIDFEMKDTLAPVIDFNLCYNPYCAYNHEYSCPIPPKENHLPLRIEAGVKKWHE